MVSVALLGVYGFLLRRDVVINAGVVVSWVKGAFLDSCFWWLLRRTLGALLCFAVGQLGVAPVLVRDCGRLYPRTLAGGLAC